MPKPKNKKEIEEQYEDCWIYILLLTTLAILIESMKNYKFSIQGSDISYGVLLLPGVYFISNYIMKKYDYKKAIAGVAISGVISVCFVAMISFALGGNMILTNVCGYFFAYVASQFVNLMIYEFLLNNTNSPFILVFLTYLFSIIVYFMIYTLIYLNMVLLDGFWNQYFITIGIEFAICLPITYLDKKIKRGI